ncbi:MAG: lipoyl(octanoyl) transferase LipB [Kiritimatiellia bacterium]
MRAPAQAFRFDKPVPYPPAAKAMDRLVEARLQGLIPDTLLFLEHEPVITFGSRGRNQFLLKPAEELEREGVQLVQSTRGGDITYHGPGQLVVYPILALKGAEADSHRYMHNLEEAAIRTCSDYSLQAFRVPGKTGAWTDQGKIAAMGVRLRRWITSHGMSFNVSVDLGYTAWIVPCGLAGQRVTSLKERLAETCPSVPAVRERLNMHLAETLDRETAWSDGPLPEALRDLAPYRTAP